MINYHDPKTGFSTYEDSQDIFDIGEYLHTQMGDGHHNQDNIIALGKKLRHDLLEDITALVFNFEKWCRPYSGFGDGTPYKPNTEAEHLLYPIYTKWLASNMVPHDIKLYIWDCACKAVMFYI